MYVWTNALMTRMCGPHLNTHDYNEQMRLIKIYSRTLVSALACSSWNSEDILTKSDAFLSQLLWIEDPQCDHRGIARSSFFRLEWSQCKWDNQMSNGVVQRERIDVATGKTTRNPIRPEPYQPLSQFCII